MTVEELRRSVENHIGPEVRLPAFLDIAGHALSRIRAFGNQRNGWSFDFTKAAFNTQAPYSTGTVAITQSSTSVTGSGTTWTSFTFTRHKLRIGGVDYPIASVGGNTAITLSEAFAGTTVTASTYEIVLDEFALPALTTIHGVWDATNEKRIVGASRRELADYALSKESTNQPTHYSVMGRSGATSVPVLQLYPAPEAITRIEYWYQADYTRIADIGDEIDLPDAMDDVLRLGAISRASQVLRRPEWREDRMEFDRAILDAWYQDQPQREAVVRLMRTDGLERSRMDSMAWTEVTT